MAFALSNISLLLNSRFIFRYFKSHLAYVAKLGQISSPFRSNVQLIVLLCMRETGRSVLFSSPYDIRSYQPFFPSFYQLDSISKFCSKFATKQVEKVNVLVGFLQSQLSIIAIYPNQHLIVCS